MDKLEKLSETIESLPPYLQSLAVEVQNKNDEYEKVKAQLLALKEHSISLNEQANTAIATYDEAALKVQKIKTFIASNPEEAEKHEADLMPILKSNVELLKTTTKSINELKVENEVIIQDITILSEDEIKVKNELEELNNTLKINLEFLEQR